MGLRRSMEFKQNPLTPQPAAFGSRASGGVMIPHLQTSEIHVPIHPDNNNNNATVVPDSGRKTSHFFPALSDRSSMSKSKDGGSDRKNSSTEDLSKLIKEETKGQTTDRATLSKEPSGGAKKDIHVSVSGAGGTMKKLVGTIGKSVGASLKKADVSENQDPAIVEQEISIMDIIASSPLKELSPEEEMKKKADLHARRQLERKKALEEKRKKALEAMQYEKVIYQPEELRYFIDVPTQVDAHLYIGSYDCIKNKKLLKFKYKITHIINCTSKENIFASHFHYITLPNKEDPLIRENFNLDKGNAACLRNPLQYFFEVLEKISKENGVLLLASDDGTGSSFIIAYLIKYRKLAFFESFQFISERRYTVDIEPQFIEQLLTFEEENYDEKHEVFQCPCGDNQWTVLSPFVNKPKRCGCHEFDSSFCPNLGCGEFCKTMLSQKTWKWTEKVLRWGYTHRDNILFIMARTEEHNPIYNLDPLQARKVKPKAWTVYRCRRCLSLTHAISNNDTTQWALVTI